MSKQRTDADKIANELTGGSAFFRKPAPAAEPQFTPGEGRQAEPIAAPSAAPTPDRTPVRPDRPKRRQMIRHSFEVYLDQLERLREAANDQRERGELGSMSKMVRDAIDRLLDERTSTHH